MALIEAIFRAHIEGGRDISQPGTLIQAGGMAGLHRREVEVFLQGGQGIQNLTEREEQVKSLGLQGVPAFFLWCPNSGPEGPDHPLFVHGNHDHQVMSQLITDLLDTCDCAGPLQQTAAKGGDQTQQKAKPRPDPRARPSFLLR